MRPLVQTKTAQQKVPPTAPNKPPQFTCVATKWWKGSEGPRYLERTRRSPRWQSASAPTLKSSKWPREDTWGQARKVSSWVRLAPRPGAFLSSPFLIRKKDRQPAALLSPPPLPWAPLIKPHPLVETFQAGAVGKSQHLWVGRKLAPPPRGKVPEEEAVAVLVQPSEPVGKGVSPAPSQPKAGLLARGQHLDFQMQQGQRIPPRRSGDPLAILPSPASPSRRTKQQSPEGLQCGPHS